MTNQELLAAIDSAISALLTGGASSYSIGSRSVTKLNLAELFKERKELLAAVDREANGGVRLAKMMRTSR